MASFTFLEFGSRQSLDRSKMTYFGNPFGYGLPISMRVYNLSKYSLCFKSYGHLSLFHNLDVGKASTNGKWYFAIPGLDLVKINMYAKFHQIFL